VWRVHYDKSMDVYRAQMKAYKEQLPRDGGLNVDDDVVMDMAEVLSGADALAAAAGADHHVIDPSLEEGFDDVDDDDDDDVLGDAHHAHHAHHNMHPHQMHQHHAQLHHDDLVALAPAPGPQAAPQPPTTRKAAAPRKPRGPSGAAAAAQAAAAAAHQLPHQTVGSVSPSSQLVATAAQQQQETAAAAVAAAVAQQQQQGKKEASKRKRDAGAEGDGRRKQVRRAKEGAPSGT
jgi:hypothetical protein